jgi:hypothetical protein
MQKWEYGIVHRYYGKLSRELITAYSMDGGGIIKGDEGDSILALLNQWGAAGWEIVSTPIFEDHSKPVDEYITIIIFKRRID